MTRIDFHFNVPHLYQRVAHLSQRAAAKGRRVFVLTPDASATEALEHTLWTFPPTGFLPHCRSNHRLAPQTPLVLDWQGDNLPHDDVIINLQTEYPPFFSRFHHLIELVGTDEDSRHAARKRFRFYRDRGYEIRTVDVATGA